MRPLALAGSGAGHGAPAQQSCNNHGDEKINKYLHLAPLRRDVVLIYRRVWSSFTGRSILLKVVVGGTIDASNCVNSGLYLAGCSHEMIVWLLG